MNEEKAEQDRPEDWYCVKLIHEGGHLMIGVNVKTRRIRAREGNVIPMEAEMVRCVDHEDESINYLLVTQDIIPLHPRDRKTFLMDVNQYGVIKALLIKFGGSNED